MQEPIPMSRVLRPVVLAFSISAVGSLSTMPLACQATGLSAASNASKTFANMGTSIGDVRDSLEKIASNLDEMSSAEKRGVSGDIQKLFSSYSSLEARLAKTAKRLDDAAAACKRETTSYLDLRRKQNASMTDAAVKQLDLKQIDELVTSEGQTRDAYMAVKSRLEPLLSSAASLETYLANNLNAAGVEAGASLFKKTAGQIRDALPALAACEREYRELADSMVPPKDRPTTSSSGA